MNPPPEELEGWLSTALPSSKKIRLLDIGAYRGDFSVSCLELGVCQSAHLFEPNPENQGHLQSLVANHKNFTLHKIALSDTVGESQFQCSQDRATGSLLEYQKPDELELTTFMVKHQTMDTWWKSQCCPDIGVIKIDTQGHDLNVLKGGHDLITRDRPWLVMEVIFVPLYTNQATLSAILHWADTQGYAFGNFFNDHFTDRGLMAFSDLVLIPKEDLPKNVEGFPARPSPQHLIEEIKQLHEICAERLKLIEHLDSEAKRLTLLLQEQPPSPSSTS